MPRPKNEYPTPAELEVLQLLWDHGALTVRQVMEHTKDQRAYTSVMSLMNVMAEKGMLEREPEGRAFRYLPVVQRSDTVGDMLGDLLSRAFDGSAEQLMVHLLDNAKPDGDELAEIRRAIASYENGGDRVNHKDHQTSDPNSDANNTAPNA